MARCVTEATQASGVGERGLFGAQSWPAGRLRVFLQERAPELAWRDLLDGEELPVEVRQVAVSHFVGDERDRLVGGHEQCARPADAQLGDVLTDGAARVPLEEPMQP